MRYRLWRHGLWSILALVSTAAVQAEVRLPAVLGSHMVLQRDQPVPVWGWADPGEEVTVTFRDQTAKTKADGDGKWKVTLKPLAVGEAATLTVAGKNKIELTDVLVGEVWLCSGQSNMAWSVANALNGDLEIAAANFPEIRLFQVPRNAQSKPIDDVIAEWALCSPATVGGFSAVGFYFGRTLHNTLGVPVGLINSSVGGTPSEAWTSAEKVAAVAEFAPTVASWDKQAAEYEPAKAQEKYQADLKKWEADAEAARKADREPPRKPAAPSHPRQNTHHPSVLFNGMIAPLVPFPIKGAIWYQGESNATRPQQYRVILPAMVESWREVWGQEKLPFYQVQLANYLKPSDRPGEAYWAELREAQALAASALPDVDAVCITDLGTEKDIHPKDKQNVGARLARMALHDLYGKTDLVRSGPTFQSLKIDGAKAVVTFDLHRANALTSYYNQPLQGFAVAGEDRVWHWADAKIVGKRGVELTSSNVPHPVAVRYNWADNPQGNLYSSAYLPATPFRTDDWPRPEKK